MQVKLFFSVILFLFQATSYSQVNVKYQKIEKGFGKLHKILTTKSGKKYFKPRNPCYGMAPIVAYHISNLLDRQTIPKTEFAMVQNKRGVLMDFIEGASTFSEDPEAELNGAFFSEKISIGEYSDLQLTRFLSGSNDRNLTNYLFKKDKIYAIDNDGDPVQVTNFPGWPFVLFHSYDYTKKVELKNFPFHKTQTMSTEEFKKYLKKFNLDLDSHPISKNEFRKRVKKWTFIEKDQDIWLQKNRDYYEPYSQRIFLKSSLKSIFKIKAATINAWIKEIKCPESKEIYITSVLEKIKILKREVIPENGYQIL